jgi:hypothetical protein
MQEDGDVRPQLPSERDHGIADGVMLLSTLCAAFVAWRYLANISAEPRWKCYCSVGLIFVLVLAGLTRRARWADSIGHAWINRGCTILDLPEHGSFANGAVNSRCRRREWSSSGTATQRGRYVIATLI